MDCKPVVYHSASKEDVVVQGHVCRVCLCVTAPHQENLVYQVALDYYLLKGWFCVRRLFSALPGASLSRKWCSVAFWFTQHRAGVPEVKPLVLCRCRGSWCATQRATGGFVQWKRVCSFLVMILLPSITKFLLRPFSLNHSLHEVQEVCVVNWRKGSKWKEGAGLGRRVRHLGRWMCRWHQSWDCALVCSFVSQTPEFSQLPPVYSV